MQRDSTWTALPKGGVGRCCSLRPLVGVLGAVRFGAPFSFRENTSMEIVPAIAAALGTSWASGINLYAAIAMLGCMHRFGAVELPGDLDVLSSWWVILIAGTLYVVEFVADKIPYVDSVWDVIHTFIRIPAGAALAAGSFADFNPTVRVLLFLVGGTIAASSHGTKAVTRVAINTSPEPFSNIVVSTGEDVMAFGVVWLAVRHPVIGIFAVLALLALTVYLLPKIIRLVVRIFKKVATILGLKEPDPVVEPAVPPVIS